MNNLTVFIIEKRFANDNTKKSYFNTTKTSFDVDIDARKNLIILQKTVEFLALTKIKVLLCVYFSLIICLHSVK